MKAVPRCNLFSCGVVISIIFWGFDTILDTFVFDRGTIAVNILGHDQSEFWMRITVVALILGFSYYASKLVVERDRVVREHENAIEELKRVLEQVKTLEGLIPICAHCKNLRDDEGIWKRMEHYIVERSNADFTHGICPDCSEKMRKEARDLLE